MMLRQFSFFFFLSLFISLSYAEDDIRYYNVEVVLFEHLNSSNQDTEEWKPVKQENENTQAELIHQLGQPYVMEAESVYDPELMFTLVPEQEYQLSEEAKKIENSTSRRVLMHTAWRQPGLSYEQAIRVYFRHQLGNNHVDEQPAAVDIPPQLDNALTAALTTQPYVEGSIKVMLARYLHVDTDIMYFAKQAPVVDSSASTEQDPDAIPGNKYRENDNALTVYQMKQLRRRIRSKELHYLDHPVLGMLIMITPYEKPEVVDKTIQTQ